MSDFEVRNGVWLDACLPWAFHDAMKNGESTDEEEGLNSDRRSPGIGITCEELLAEIFC
jgi:hypothetical protein